MAGSKKTDKRNGRGRRLTAPKARGKRPAVPRTRRGEAVAPSPELSLAPTASGAAAHSSARKIVLGDVLDQNAAAPLHAEFLSHRGIDAVVDAGAVRRIGGQCLQVLLSAAATWARDGAALAVVNASPDFVAGVQLLGIEPRQLESQKPFAGAA